MTSFKQKLNKLKISELKSILSRSHIAYPDKMKKAEIIDFISSTVEDRLSNLKVGELKQLSTDLSIDIRGQKKKDGIITQIMLELEPDRLPLLFSNIEDDLVRIGSDIVDIGKDIEETIGLIQRMPVSGDIDEIDKVLFDLSNADVDISSLLKKFDMGRVMFKDRKFIDTIDELTETNDICTAIFSDFEDILYAHLILACENLIEKCNEIPSSEKRDTKILVDAKRGFKAGGSSRENSVRALIIYATGLYHSEINKIRESIVEIDSFITTMKLQGVDVFNAERYLNRARDSLNEVDFVNAIEYLDKSKNSANESQESWKSQIIDDVPRVERVISAANELGADVIEADKMLNQAKIALDNEDFALCAELTKISERKAMEIQQSQIQKAAQLERRQLGEVRDSLASMEPIIQEAFIYGIDIGEINKAIQNTKNSLVNNDYVNGKISVREAGNLVKLIWPRIEDFRKNIVSEGSEFHNCPSCGKTMIKVFDNHWARCMSCGLIWPPPPESKKKKWSSRLFK